jgi:hypothetical protein
MLGTSPQTPIEGTERLPTPKRRRFANKLPYVRVDLAELPRCLNRPDLSHVNSRNCATTLVAIFEFEIVD